MRKFEAARIAMMNEITSAYFKEKDTARKHGKIARHKLDKIIKRFKKNAAYLMYTSINQRSKHVRSATSPMSSKLMVGNYLLCLMLSRNLLP